MPSNIIITFQTKADTTGTDQVGKNMERLKQQMRETAESASDIGVSFGNLRNLIAGTVLTLPLVGFIKEAIRSEEITARFSRQLGVLGESVSGIDIEGLTRRVHEFGISQTELIQAFSKGLPYFRSTQRELELLNTAIGMTRYSGVDLSTAFQQLGYIMLYGSSRVARQYGISIHSEIRDPTMRAAAVVRDLTTAMEPLATQSGTTAEALKQMGVTIHDTAEILGKEFLGAINLVATGFNKLPEWTKEAIVNFVLLGAAVQGVTLLVSGLQKMLAGLGVIGLATKLGLSVPQIALIIAGLAVLGQQFGGLVKQQEEINALRKEEEDISKRIRAFEVSSINAAIGLQEKFTDKIEQTIKARETFWQLAMAGGREATTPENLGVIKTINTAIIGMEKYRDSWAQVNIDSLAGVKKFFIQLDQLRNASTQEGLTKDLNALRIKYQTELLQAEITYNNEANIRKAIFEKAAKDEADIRKKYLEKELDYALMSNEERKKYDEDYAEAKEELSSISIENLKEETDELKEFLKTSEGAKKALKERLDLEVQRQTNLQQQYPVLAEIMALERGEALLSMERKIKTPFALEEKEVEAPLTYTNNINVTITPSFETMLNEMVVKLKEEFEKLQAKTKDDISKFALRGMQGWG
jgi:hypothetical protein